MTIFEMAKQYYPRLWNESRIRQLVNAGKLSEEEYQQITGNPYQETAQAVK